MSSITSTSWRTNAEYSAADQGWPATGPGSAFVHLSAQKMAPEPIDWRAVGVQMKARMDAKDARRIERRGALGCWPRASTLEAHHRRTRASERSRAKTLVCSGTATSTTTSANRCRASAGGAPPAAAPTTGSKALTASGRDPPRELGVHRRVGAERLRGVLRHTRGVCAKSATRSGPTRTTTRDLRNERARALQMVFCQVYYGVRLLRARGAPGRASPKEAAATSHAGWTQYRKLRASGVVAHVRLKRT